MSKYLTAEEIINTGFLSVYEKGGEWCFNTIEWGGVVPICGETRELAVVFQEEYRKQQLALEQAVWGKRKDVDASSAQVETDEGAEADEG